MGCVTDSWKFYPGESKALEINLVTYNSAHDCKEIFTISDDPGRKITIVIPGDPNDLSFDLTTAIPVVVVSEALGKIKLNLNAASTALMRSGSVTITHDALGDGTSVTIFTAVRIVVKQEVAEC